MVHAGEVVRYAADTRITFKLGIGDTISAAASWDTRRARSRALASVEDLYRRSFHRRDARNARNSINWNATEWKGRDSSFNHAIIADDFLEYRSQV